MKKCMRIGVLGVFLVGSIIDVDAMQSRYYRVFTAEAQGWVFYADGQTPAVEVPVRIWDLGERQFIYETFTDRDGAFDLPRMSPGRYFITFDTLKLELEFAALSDPTLQQPHDIIVIIPRVTAAMPLTQLGAYLLASSISEGALLYRDGKRQTVVSP